MKEIIILIVLSGLFILASFMVLVTGGKNPYFLRKKLRIGAIIISLTAIIGIVAGCKPQDRPYITCYEVEFVEDPQGTGSSGNEVNQTVLD
jgi:hypothetical protein